MKLRLFLFDDCNRSCIGCCNKDWEIRNLPIETNFFGYDEILLTGGEPMLKPLFVMETIIKIKNQSSAKIYLYTSKLNDPYTVLSILNFIDGITVTLHDKSDIYDFIIFDFFLKSLRILPSTNKIIETKTFRLNIFKNVNLNIEHYKKWVIKNNIEWIKNSPLPKNEIFKRLERG